MNYLLKEYDNLLQLVFETGDIQKNRTGIDTRSIFGAQVRYNISERFPLITKRKMFPRSIFAELLWILSGSTNVHDLEKLGSKIWTPWIDPAFEARNFYPSGELGPVYGWQLRNFGGNHGGGSEVKTEGFDQLAYVVEELKTNPTSRRIMFSYWNPSEVTTDRVKLPPCHFAFILNVTGDRLNGMLCQRSCDLVAGANFNVCFYSALIYMLAQQCGFKPGEFIHSIADAHIYSNQFDAVIEYLHRPKVISPKFTLTKAKDIYSYSLEDFNIIEYNPLGKIETPLAI